MTGSAKLPFGRRVNSEGDWCINTPVSLTGTTSETLLARVLVPGGYVGSQGTLKIKMVASNSNSADDKTFAVKVGTLFTSEATLVTHVHTTETLEVIEIELTNKDSVASQHVLLTTTKPSTASAISVVTDPTLDTDNAFYIDVYGTLENAVDTMSLDVFIVTATYRD